MMSGSPTLSVFMPVYNGGPYLATAIRSVLDQTFGDFEFLIVDDGSTDDSVATIESFKDPRIRLIRQENQGCYPARNRAIAEARGKYLANMDADDISLPERFEKQIEYLEKYPEAVLVGTRTLGCDREDQVRLPHRIFIPLSEDHQAPHIVDSNSLKFGPLFSYQTILFRKALLGSIAPYDTRLCYAADVDFVVRASQVGGVACLPDQLFVFRIVPTAISGSGSLIQREIISIIRSAASRAKQGEEHTFSEVEAHRIKELENLKNQNPFPSSNKKEAFYETRLATLYRINGLYREAATHALKALRLSPGHIFTDRKLASTLIKSWFGFRPHSPLPENTL